MGRDSSSEEMSELVTNAERHLTHRQAEQLLAELRVLAKHTIYSDVHEGIYERHENLKPGAVKLLFEELPFEHFVEMSTEDLFSPSEIWEVLDTIHEGVSADQILDLSDEMGFPSEQYASHIFRKLVHDPRESTTRRLAERIDQLAMAEAEEGASMSTHRKTISTFRYLRWMPDDKGLSETVHILGLRGDEPSRELKRKYLLTLPWGEDRSATSALLQAISGEKSDDNRALLREALERHARPSELRLTLLRAYMEYDSVFALKTAVSDLSRTSSDDGRIEYIDWFWSQLEKATQEGDARELRTVGDHLAGLSTGGWSFLSRGYLGILITRMFPELSPGRVSNTFERCSMRFIGIFEIARLDHMGCMVSLPVLLGVGYLLLWLLDLVVGKPRQGMSLADDICVVAWIISAGLTSRTHFSGHETLAQRFSMAMVFFGTFLAFVGISIAIRIW
ncbi:hypothetical protein ACFL0Q_07510 [Thermodesulfobacteriota bacterium]